MRNLGMECHWNVKKETDVGIRSWICGEYFWTPGAGKCWQFPTSSQGGGSEVDLRKFRLEEPSVRHKLEEKYRLFSSIPSVIMGCKCNCALQLGAFIKFVFQRLCYSERYLYIMQASKVSGSCMYVTECSLHVNCINRIKYWAERFKYWRRKTLFSEMLVQCACAALEGRGVTRREGDV